MASAFTVICFLIKLFFLSNQVDGGFFLQNSRILANGGEIYRPGIANYNPLIFCIYRLWFAIFGENYFLSHLVPAIGVLAAGVIMGTIPLTQKRGLFYAILGFCLLILSFFLFGGSVIAIEPIAAPFVVLSLAIAWQLSDEARLSQLFLLGFVSGMVFFAKQN